jgi:hypothetical protein
MCGCGCGCGWRIRNINAPCKVRLPCNIYKYSVGEKNPCLNIKWEVSVQCLQDCLSGPIGELLSNKTMCGCPTLSTKENRNVDWHTQNCFGCLEPLLLRLKKLPKHTMSTQISCVLFHSRCSACCRGPDNMLCLLFLGYSQKCAV